MKIAKFVVGISMIPLALLGLLAAWAYEALRCGWELGVTGLEALNETKLGDSDK